jgi:hypothetical protein
MSVPPHLGSFYAMDLFLITELEVSIAKGMPSQDISSIHTTWLIHEIPS